MTSATEDYDTRERELREIADDTRSSDGLLSWRGHTQRGYAGGNLTQSLRVFVRSAEKVVLAALLGAALAVGVIAYHEADSKASASQVDALSARIGENFSTLTAGIAEAKTAATIAKNHADNLKSEHVDALETRVTAIEQRGPQRIIVEEVNHVRQQ
jgi:hypothetical protein